MTFCIHDVRISISRLMISYLIKILKVKKGAYMKKCEGIYSLIGKVNHKSAIYGFELLKEENIHPRQMPLIIHLKKCEGCTQKELAEKMQVKPSTLNVMIGRMEKNGYIEKKQDEKDSRKSRIYFTEKGRSICEDGHKKFVMIQEKLQEYFTKEEQEELKRLLNKFCDCLDEQTEILKKERNEKSDA